MRRKTTCRVEALECRSLLSGLVASVTTDHSVYLFGQPIEMTFTYTNTGNTVATFGAGPSFDGFNVTQGGQTVWQSNAGFNSELAFEETLEPGQSFRLNATWVDVVPGTSSSTPSSGTYVITNQLDPSGPSATIQIDPRQFTASLATNHATTHAGEPVRIAITLENIATTTQSLAADAVSAGLTVTYGSTVIARTAINSKARLVKPGESVELVTFWNGKPNQAGATKTPPGMYTIEFTEGPYSATGQIRVV